MSVSTFHSLRLFADELHDLLTGVKPHRTESVPEHHNLANICLCADRCLNNDFNPFPKLGSRGPRSLQGKEYKIKQ